jgi:thiamine-phosphate pyrophosphorylase
MNARQTTWPKTWLMTDERLGDRMWEAIDRLPAGSGIVFRHYSLPNAERASLAIEIAGFCRERAFTLAVAGDAGLAVEVGADLIHNPTASTELPYSRAVHSIAEAEAAAAEDPSLVFVSPIFATSSHPGQEPLGRDLAAQIAEAARAPAIALGGMDARRFAQLKGFYGWAGIDAWLGTEES